MPSSACKINGAAKHSRSNGANKLVRLHLEFVFIGKIPRGQLGPDACACGFYTGLGPLRREGHPKTVPTQKSLLRQASENVAVGRSLPLVLAPGEGYHDEVEYRQKDHGDGMREDETIDLIADKARQNNDHCRVGPQLVHPQGNDKDEFHRPVRKKIPGSKMFAAGTEPYEVISQMRGYKILAIFREFRGDEVHDYSIECAR